MLDTLIESPWGDCGGFAVAALLGSVLSFFLNRRWFFGLALEPNGNDDLT